MATDWEEEEEVAEVGTHSGKGRRVNVGLWLFMLQIYSARNLNPAAGSDSDLCGRACAALEFWRSHSDNPGEAVRKSDEVRHN